MNYLKEINHKFSATLVFAFGHTKKLQIKKHPVQDQNLRKTENVMIFHEMLSLATTGILFSLK